MPINLSSATKLILHKVAFVLIHDCIFWYFYSFVGFFAFFFFVKIFKTIQPLIRFNWANVRKAVASAPNSTQKMELNRDDYSY